MREIFPIYNHHEVLAAQKAEFSGLIAVKMGAVAARIADILGGEARDISELDPHKTGSDRNYVVPADALSVLDAHRYGIFDADSIHGAIVSNQMQAEKGALHLPVSPEASVPSWYSRTFARKLGEAAAVLPGFTVFTEEDAQLALARLQGDGFSARFKKLPESQTRGQYPVETPDQLQEVIHKDLATFLECGAVIEASLRDFTELDLGYVRMGGEDYSWIGAPVNEPRFQTELTVVRGGFDDLATHITEPNELTALRQAQTVFDTYRESGAIIGRAVFDVLQGNVTEDTFVSGVVDPSLRIGGSTPAELRAIEVLRKSPDITKVRTCVASAYTDSPGDNMDDYEVFARQPGRDIYVKVIDAA